MTSPRVTPEGLLGVTDDPAAALRYPSIGALLGSETCRADGFVRYALRR
jgi:hypothetical protein